MGSISESQTQNTSKDSPASGVTVSFLVPLSPLVLTKKKGGSTKFCSSYYLQVFR